MKKFVVGGAVRDRLLGLSPKDVDFVVVGSTPAEMLASGFKQVGADFPVFLDADGTEYALARTERKTGRGYTGFETDAGPTVTLEEDLERRDLTINAMACASDMTLVDPFDGRRDLENRVLRHVSKAFADDPVRVLRLARFHARYGAEWTVAPETLEFSRQLVDSGEMAFLTKERVLKELEKALAEASPHLFFETLDACGALNVVFSEFVGIDRKALAGVLVSFPSRSVRFNWAKLTTLLPDPDAMEKRLNVSIHHRAFSRLFREATALSDVHPVDRLYAMDAYRQQWLWDALLQDSKEASLNLDFLETAFELTKHVSFETLSEEARLKLKGKEIGEAIRKQRHFAYASGVNRKK